MKKIIISSVLATIGILTMAVPVLATTLSFSPSYLQVTKGHTVSVSIVADPAGATDYTEKVELKYPADLLAATSFNFTNSWIALNQPGYDSIDNVNGVMIKTAGYPAGFSSPTTLGTVTFQALKVGSGTITVGGNSIAFQVNSQSVLTGSPLSLNISAPVAVPVKPVASSTLATTTQEGTSTQIASANASNVNIWIIILLIVLVLETGAFIYYVAKQKKG